MNWLKICLFVCRPKNWGLLGHPATFAATATLIVALCCFARADSNRLTLAAQENYQTNIGFYLDLENAAGNNGAVEPLNALTLDLGVADGSSWRWLSTQPAWRYNHVYHVECIISPTGATMSLDGAQVASNPGSLSIDSADGAVCNQVPLWACTDAEYWLCENSVEILDGGSVLLKHAFPPTAKEIKTYMFTPQQALLPGPLVFKSGKTITIDAAFTIVDKLSYAPVVDEYGQWNYGSWPTKIASTGQLIAGVKSEKSILAAMPSPQGLDKYGGDKNAGWTEPATGFFAATQHNGYWWLITPDGNPCFYTGVDDAIGFGGDMGTPISGRTQLFAALPPTTGTFAAAYVPTVWGDTGTTYYSFIIANAIRKYGADWMSYSKSLLKERLQKWGFSGIGKWSNTPGGLPYISNLYYWAPTLYDTKPDIFDPVIVQDLKASLQSQVAAGANDPYLVGWAVGNEEPDCVANGTVAAVLQVTTATPGKQALVNYTLNQFYGGSVAAMASGWGVTASSAADLYAQALNAPAAQQEPLREYFENNYFHTMYQIVKGLDPHHIYFGDWQCPAWNYNPSDWTIDAKYCDVMGYDNYSTNFGDGNLAQYAQQIGKPILCGEFGYPPTYNGIGGFSQYFNYANFDADAGADYANWMSQATQNPYCVGGCWFMYRDEAVTGRGPGNGLSLVFSENYAFGTVDTADQPKWALVDAMAAANMSATKQRLTAASASAMKRPQTK